MKRYFSAFFKICVLWVALYSLSLWVLPQKEGVKDADIRLAVQTAPRTLNPFQATDAASVRLLQHITPALGTFDSTFTIQTDRAANITPTTTGYRITLPEHATWHNGAPLLAQDVVDIYTRLQNDTSPYKSLITPLKNIRATGEKTLIIDMDTADPYHTKVLTVPLFKMQKGIPIGLGAFRISDARNLMNIRLTHIDTGKNVLLQTIPSPDVRLMALQKGDIDIAHGDIAPELLAYAHSKGFQVTSAPAESYSYIGFNVQNAPTNDLNVRKAIAFALDRDTLIHALLKEAAAPALSLLMPEHEAAFNIHPPAHNLARAQSLMKSLGYSAEHPLTITLSITNSASVNKLAQVIQAQLKDAYIKLNIQSTEWGTFYENVKKGAVEMYILTWVGAFDTDFLNQVYNSANVPPHGNNRGFYKNEMIDNLLTEMMHTPKGERHNQLAREVQKITAQAHIYIPLWRAHHVAILKKEIQGYRIPTDGGYPLENLILSLPKPL